MASRVGGFVRRRLADVALVVVWLLAIFQLVQIRGPQEETTTEVLVTVVVALGLGLATTVLWLRSRRTKPDPRAARRRRR